MGKRNGQLPSFHKKNWFIELGSVPGSALRDRGQDLLRFRDRDVTMTESWSRAVTK
jgi:hypothetical protein